MQLSDELSVKKKRINDGEENDKSLTPLSEKKNIIDIQDSMFDIYWEIRFEELFGKLPNITCIDFMLPINQDIIKFIISYGNVEASKSVSSTPFMRDLINQCYFNGTNETSFDLDLELMRHIYYRMDVRKTPISPTYIVENVVNLNVLQLENICDNYNYKNCQFLPAGNIVVRDPGARGEAFLKGFLEPYTKSSVNVRNIHYCIYDGKEKPIYSLIDKHRQCMPNLDSGAYISNVSSSTINEDELKISSEGSSTQNSYEVEYRDTTSTSITEPSKVLSTRLLENAESTENASLCELLQLISNDTLILKAFTSISEKPKDFWKLTAMDIESLSSAFEQIINRDDVVNHQNECLDIVNNIMKVVPHILEDTQSQFNATAKIFNIEKFVIKLADEVNENIFEPTADISFYEIAKRQQGTLYNIDSNNYVNCTILKNETFKLELENLTLTLHVPYDTWIVNSLDQTKFGIIIMFFLNGKLLNDTNYINQFIICNAVTLNDQRNNTYIIIYGKALLSGDLHLVCVVLLVSKYEVNSNYLWWLIPLVIVLFISTIILCYKLCRNSTAKKECSEIFVSNINVAEEELSLSTNTCESLERLVKYGSGEVTV